jgi:hypothetical protein
VLVGCSTWGQAQGQENGKGVGLLPHSGQQRKQVSFF